MAGGTMRIGADVGGTFTDVVLETGAGMFSTKVRKASRTAASPAALVRP